MPYDAIAASTQECEPLVSAVTRLGAPLTLPRNAEIYAQGDPVERMYLVVGGTIRTSRLGLDGRRQIGDFYGPGDLLGLEQVLAVGAGELAGALLDATRRELERAHAHMWMLGLKNAREKVVAFLGSRAPAPGGGLCDLPMGRQDMADYLGLTLETVSRMLSQLQADEVVEFASARAFRIRNWAPLERIAA